MVPYSHQSIDADDIASVVKVLQSDWLTQGPSVKEFEEALKKETRADFAAAFSSGTAALEAAYFAAGIKKGDEIITSPLTFSATANAALWAGAKIIFADVEQASGNIDPREVLKKITPKTKAIVPVDYAGLPAKIDELSDIARQNNLILIEDAAHSLGATYKGKKVGGIADMTMFSFHPVKSITTGEGGAIMTNDQVLYERLILFREHGITKDRTKFKGSDEGPWYYEMQELAHNYRLTDIQAALGLSQIKKLSVFVDKRAKVASRYKRAFMGDANFILPQDFENTRSSWHLYPLRLAGKCATRRKKIFTELRALGIGVQVHYIPVYLNPFYQGLGYKKGLCPRAEAFYETELSIPIFPGLSVKDQDFVIKTIEKLSRL